MTALKQKISIIETTPVDNRFGARNAADAETVLFVDLPDKSAKNPEYYIPMSDLSGLQSQMGQIKDLMQENASLSALSEAAVKAQKQTHKIIDQIQAQGMAGAAKLIAEKYGMFAHPIKTCNNLREESQLDRAKHLFASLMPSITRANP